ncbi:MAG: hypothetical protein JXA30_17965 [Deltaproteobacteria bacterium]|nr:hypothetical protein [Deltaproteobacteria bacterium]
MVGLVLLCLLSECKTGCDGDNNVEEDASVDTFTEGGQRGDASKDDFRPSFTVGGTLSGLAIGASVVLQNNQKDNLTLEKNGSFTFSTELPDKAEYQVQVSAQPMEQTCVVTNHEGTISGADVTNISVVCTVQEGAVGNSFTVGGVVTGLEGIGLILQNNGGDDLAINRNGAFRFATRLEDASGYNVTIASQPKSPDQLCTVTDGSGTLKGVDVADVTVLCSRSETGPSAIDMFKASSQFVSAGDEVTLSWMTHGFTSCDIYPGRIAAEPAAAGSEDVNVSVTTDFVLTCRGRNGYASSDPVTVTVLDPGWKSISSGDDHCCAIKRDGRLFCWGKGSEGQLGNAPVSNSTIPVQEYTTATDWSTVSAGGDHTCAIKADGRLFCWGANNSGQIGLIPVESNPLEHIQESTAATDWSQVSAGRGSTCAIKDDRRLFCWGSYLGLGNGSDNGLSREPVREYTAATDWAQVSAGANHTCAIKTDGRLFYWGRVPGVPSGGGFSPYDYNNYNVTIPEPESTAATDWAQVSAGANHTCAIKTDGGLFCWGYGSIDPSIADRTEPRQLMVPTRESTAATDWAQVSAGAGFTCAVKTDGRLFCWGTDDYGQLGHEANSTEDQWVPVQESTAATDWSQVSAGSNHTCALKSDRQIFCWGANYHGQLGNNSTSNNIGPVL